MSAPTPSAAIQLLILDHCAVLGRSAAACERSAARQDCVASIAASEASRLRAEQAHLEAIVVGGRVGAIDLAAARDGALRAVVADCAMSPSIEQARLISAVIPVRTA